MSLENEYKYGGMPFPSPPEEAKYSDIVDKALVAARSLLLNAWYVSGEEQRYSIHGQKRLETLRFLDKAIKERANSVQKK